MAITVASNFAGKAAGFYISAALKASNSLDYLTMIENIKFKSNVQALNQTVNSVVDATCDFTAAGTLLSAFDIFIYFVVKVTIVVYPCNVYQT